MIKLLLLIAFLSLMSSATHMLDCVCIRDPNPSPEKVKVDRRQAYDKAAAVFLGKVIVLNAYTVKFRLEKRWKGDSEDEIVLSTGAVTGIDETPLLEECSYQFRLGEEYLVYAYRLDGKLKTDICSTLKAKDALEEEKGLDEIRVHETIRGKSD
jgi:hypothetical protein